MNKEIKRLFIVLGLFAFSGGLFYNFQELWMASNSLSIKTISIVFSLCALISVSVIFLLSSIIEQSKIKKMTKTLLLIKAITIFLLFILNHTGVNPLIKFLIMLDYALDVEIYTSIYPMITLITKDDKIFTIREFIYDGLYFFGVLLSSFLLGKVFFKFTISYNSYVLLAFFPIIIAYYILKKTDLEQYVKKDKKKKNSNDILYQLMSEIKKDKITKCYLAYAFVGYVAIYAIEGLLITMLTQFIGLSPVTASNLKLIVGILSIGLGIIILAKLTSKNDYLNIGIKFIGRLVTYILAMLFPINGVLLLAIIYTEIFNNSYTHVTDAPYINRFDGDYQLAFCNLRSMVRYFARAIGLLICGHLIVINIRYVFAATSILVALQIYFAMKGVKLRKMEAKK